MRIHTGPTGDYRTIYTEFASVKEISELVQSLERNA